MSSLLRFIDYLLLEKKYSTHTISSYKKDINEFSDFARETLQISLIDKVDYSVIRNWIVHLVGKEISNRTVNRKISSLKAYYKFLLKTQQIKATPLAKHKPLKVNKTLQVPFSEKEMQLVLEELSATAVDFEGIRNRLIVELFYVTGIRRAELVNLKMRNIFLDQSVIKVFGKRNKERIIPLLDSFKESLQKYLQERAVLPVIKDSDFVFLTKKGRKIYETLVYRVVNSYFSKASEKTKKSPHILRHSFATHLLILENQHPSKE